MLIKISHDTYINPESVDAIQKNTTYIRNYDGDGERKVEDVVIYTRGGGKFYYDGTLEQCIEQLTVKGGRE